MGNLWARGIISKCHNTLCPEIYLIDSQVLYTLLINCCIIDFTC